MLTRSMSKLLLQSPTGTPGLSFVSPSPSPGPGARLASSPSLRGLDRLPQELLVTILSYLPLSDIGKLSLCGSMRIREQITSWINTRNFRNKVDTSTIHNFMNSSFLKPVFFF